MSLSRVALLSAPERVDRCVNALASHPAALDILLTSLIKAVEHPNTERYRKVPVEHPTFKRVVGSVTGGTELLFAVGYEPMYGHLVLQKWDEQLLKRAIQGLEAAKAGSTYQKARAELDAEKARAEQAAREHEAIRAKRAGFASLVPKEPDPAEEEATSCVEISVQNDAGAKVARRRFDSENTLRNLLDYIRSLDITPIEGTIKIQNVTTAPFAELDIERCLDCSLYSLDLWPVSHVRIVAAKA